VPLRFWKGGEMDPTEWRSQMGRGIGPWASGPEMVYEVTDSSWALVSGAPSADLNMRLVWGDDADAVTSAMVDLERRQVPALVMLAGAAKTYADAAREDWQQVGEMPIMQLGLAAADRGPDPRVRRAGPDDLEAVTGLMADSYGMVPEVARLVAVPLLDPTADLVIWLLEDGGEAVSTVTGTFVDATVTLWCMGTPPRFARRGYARALLAAVLDEAHGRGATVGLLGATPAGLPLYESTGWTMFETWLIFTNASSVQFH
jgi:GNAT superfamily N-acetyltransferase